jgi:hypothetical protein
MPKNERMWVPVMYDPTSKKKLFRAILQESALRALGEYPFVMAKYIGLPPNGSTIGNRALRNRNTLLANSAINLQEG